MCPKTAIYDTGEELKNIVLPSDLDRETMVFPKVDREPRIVGTKCVGCHLCRLVCPTGAIGQAKRMPKPQKESI